MKKTILHLCADLGSDSRPYSIDDKYEVILIGEKYGVENYHPDRDIHGIIANPVCTDLSTASGFHKPNDIEKGMWLVNECLRVVSECNPCFWVLENPFNGRLKDKIGAPKYVYQPWQYGSPWTKKTALWGSFNIPKPVYRNWSDVPKNEDLYVRPGRLKPSLAFLHKSSIHLIPEFQFAIPHVKNDADFRSLCSQGFASAFYRANP